MLALTNFLSIVISNPTLYKLTGHKLIPLGHHLENLLVITKFSIIFFEFICSVTVNALLAYIVSTYALKIVLE